MEKEKNFLKLFMERLTFPKEAISVFNNLESILIPGSNFMSLVNGFMDKEIQIENVLDELDKMSNDIKISNYTLHFYFYMKCSYILYNRFIANNISEEVFWNTINDLKCKLMECYEIYGVWGTFVATWFPRFFDMTRFAIGRFQYETINFPYELYEKKGVTVKKGDIVYNIHIPSSGPLLKAARMESYRKAAVFYKENFKNRPTAFVCNSWLLFPSHIKFLPKTSNILTFMNDFDIISSGFDENYNDLWRIFYKQYTGNIEELPKETSLQRAYVDWLRTGNKVGYGNGVFLFDGEQIIR
jgi:hypothetical protein